MMGGFPGILSFTSPWMLAGLLALPAIWLLLRLTPPRPRRLSIRVNIDQNLAWFAL